jgi:hypothetical protein
MQFVCHIDGDDKNANDAAKYVIFTAEYLQIGKYITVRTTHSFNFVINHMTYAGVLNLGDLIETPTSA